MAMKKVPQSLRHCSPLQRLDISCNRIPDLDDSGLDMLRLQQLKAQNNRLTRLPDQFAQMHELRYLIISNNKFDHLPPVVCDIPNLIDLDVSFNLLSSLPEEVSRLRNLERLIVVGNQITTLPGGCSRLTLLKELDCRRNLIDDISLVARLPTLETLRADHNVLHSLDFTFGPRLETLDVSHNDITKLLAPEDDPSAESYALKSLDLSHAKLSSLDNLPFNRLARLQIIKLDYNSFRSLPDSFSLMDQLEEFSCTNNLLGVLPESIGGLQHLRKINVQHNNLKEIPATLWSCASLTTLNATSNLLKVWHATTEISNATTSEGLPLASSLCHLYLGDNQLDEEAFSVLIKLRNLETLNLSFNEIQDIPRWYFGGATQLQELFLSGNKLSCLPTEDLNRMTKLRALYLNGNRLVTLPAELSKCTNLEVLDVGSNLLKYNINNWEFDWNW
jgi:adenylate cyclase